MSFWARIAAARFKSLARPSFWAAFFLLMAVIPAAGRLFDPEAGARIRVGVYTDADTRARVAYYTAGSCETIAYTDLARMRLDVAAHRLECAYAFPLGDDGGLIAAYRSPWTVSADVLDLLMAAVRVEQLAGELGADALRGFVDENAATAEVVRLAAQAYLRDGALMETVYVETGDGPPEDGAHPFSRLFAGLTGLFGYLLALLGGMGLGGAEKAMAGRLRMAGRSAGGYALTGMAVVFVVTGLFMSGASAIGHRLYPGLTPHLGGAVYRGWAFAFAMAGVSLCLSALARRDAAGLVALLFIGAALLGGTVFDIREVWAAAGAARFLFPHYYYLTGQAGVLWGIGAAAGALLFLNSDRPVI